MEEQEAASESLVDLLFPPSIAADVASPPATTTADVPLAIGQLARLPHFVEIRPELCEKLADCCAAQGQRHSR